MNSKLTKLFAAAAILGGLAATPMAFAETVAEKSMPAPQSPQSRGATGDHGGMMGMMGQMSPDQMKQMARMADNCNRMMEGMSNAPTGPEKAPSPAPRG